MLNPDSNAGPGLPRFHPQMLESGKGVLGIEEPAMNNELQLKCDLEGADELQTLVGPGATVPSYIFGTSAVRKRSLRKQQSNFSFPWRNRFQGVCNRGQKFWHDPRRRFR